MRLARVTPPMAIGENRCEVIRNFTASWRAGRAVGGAAAARSRPCDASGAGEPYGPVFRRPWQRACFWYACASRSSALCNRASQTQELPARSAWARYQIASLEQLVAARRVVLFVER